MINAASHGLWRRTAPSAPATSALIGAMVADVAVVGAGYTGLSAALHLAEAGAKVAVLEAAEIGFGGSGRNAGLVNAGLWLPPDDICAALGTECGERILDVLGRAPGLVFELIDRHGIDCEAVRNGTLHLAAGQTGLRQLERRAAQWARRGAPVRLLGGEETARAVGAAHYPGSLRDDRAGTVQPLAYARGLARAALGRGARIFTSSAVQGAEREQGQWRLRTACGSVLSDWVVVGTNAYSGALWPELKAEFVPLPGYQCATHPLEGEAAARILPGREGCWDTRQVLIWFRREAAGRVIFGSVGALRGGSAAVHRAYAWRRLARMFPFLGPVRFEDEWYGWMAMTDDHLPRYHELAPNVICFHGYNGRGIGTGTMFGKLLAQRILAPGAEMPLPAISPEPARLRALRAAYYEAGSLVAHLV
jgi:sarcosine oxidase